MICLICTDIGIVANHHGVDAMVPPRLWGRADQLRPRCGRAATAPPCTSAPRRDQQLSQDLKIPTKDPQPHVPTVAAEVLISTPIQTIARLQLANCRLDPRVTPPCLAVSNSERGYHVFSDVGTKLEFVGFNEAVHVRVATDIFSRIGLTRCRSDPYIPSAGCGDLIS